MTRVELAYGDRYLSVDIPDQNLIGVLRPKSLPVVPDIVEAVRTSLGDPIGSPSLEDLIPSAKQIAIVVDDATRPTPTAQLIKPIFDLLSKFKTRDEQVKIVCAAGAHRPPTSEEWNQILGMDVLERFETLSNDVNDTQSFTYLGRTSRGTPVEMNKVVVESDLRILVGVIKPHGLAGYSGGGKSLLPGVSGLNTIMADHGFKATAHPRSVLGVIEGNPIREDIEEAAQMVGPCFVVNAVLNPHHQVVGVVCGDMIQAHRRGAAILDQMAKVSVGEQADIALCGCGQPMDINLYQANNASGAVWRLPVPAVKPGGTIILTALCPEGVGHRDFYQLLRKAPSASAFLEDLAAAETFYRDQWAAQCWADMVSKVQVIVVSENLTREEVENLHAVFASSLDEALEMAFKQHGHSARVLVLPEAPFTIPVVQ